MSNFFVTWQQNFIIMAGPMAKNPGSVLAAVGTFPSMAPLPKLFGRKSRHRL